MATVPERIATLERAVIDMSAMIDRRVAEETRTRDRLHGLEGAVRAWTDLQVNARQSEIDRGRSIERRLQALTVVVAVAAFGLALITVFIH